MEEQEQELVKHEESIDLNQKQISDENKNQPNQQDTIKEKENADQGSTQLKKKKKKKKRKIKNIASLKRIYNKPEFNLSGLQQTQYPIYNALKDNHLYGFFYNKYIRRHLIRMGLITKDGYIIEDKGQLIRDDHIYTFQDGSIQTNTNEQAFNSNSLPRINQKSAQNKDQNQIGNSKINRNFSQEKDGINQIQKKPNKKLDPINEKSKTHKMNNQTNPLMQKPVQPKKKQQAQQENSEFKGVGQFYIKIVQARNLSKEDCEPFVVFNLNKSNVRKCKTKTIDDMINPIWNHEEILKVQVNEADAKDLKLVIEVVDEGFNQDDLLNKCIIDLGSLMWKPGKWINQYYQLRDPNDQETNSQIYIQAQWRNEGFQNTTPNPKITEDLTQNNNKKERKFPSADDDKMIGKIMINVIDACNLRDQDPQGQSDPFCVIQLKNNNEVIKEVFTNLIEDSLNPKWNCKRTIKIHSPKADIGSLKFLVYVYDKEIDEKNNLIGSAEINAQDIFDNPGKWINDIFKLKNQQGLENKQDIQLQFQWRPQDEQNFEQEQPESKR